MNWLEAAVRKVSRELTKPFLFFKGIFGQSFAESFHLQSYNVLSSDVHELLSFSDLLTTVNDKQRDVKNDVLELLNRFSELSNCRELITRLTEDLKSEKIGNFQQFLTCKSATRSLSFTPIVG